jgi:hypothetical protein
MLLMKTTHQTSRPKYPTVNLNQICSTLKKGCDNSIFQNFIYFLTDFQDIYFCELDVLHHRRS